MEYLPRAGDGRPPWTASAPVSRGPSAQPPHGFSPHVEGVLIDCELFAEGAGVGVNCLPQRMSVERYPC
jgi:hypothetical protein